MTDHDRDQRLLDEFNVPTLDAWRDEVVRLLRGVPYEKKMMKATPEGVTVHGMYTRHDLAEIDTLDALPGDHPFVRAKRAIGHRNGWQIAQALPFPDYDEFNDALRHDLQRGQSAINLILDEATMLGFDPDQAEIGQVGRGGTSIASVVGLSRALQGVDLEKTPLHVEAGVAALPVAALVVALMRERENDVRNWKGSAGMDPLAGLATFGALPIPLKWAYEELAILTRWAHEHAPDLKTISVYGHPYRDAGADAATELACVMATAVAALREMERRDIAPEIAAGHVLMGLTTGNDFFLEIAKLRAARMLWARIVETLGGTPDIARALHIHSRTSTHRLSRLDPHTNMLRATTEAFSAVLGGCDSLHVAPYDAALRQVPDDMARRIARNTQLILLEEAHANTVIDPAGGSYAVERLTADLAQSAWDRFQAIEGEGGMLASLRAGTIQSRVAEQADHRATALGTRKNVLVGVNRYPNPTEAIPADDDTDWGAIHDKRAEAMQQLRTSATHQQELKVMESLQAIITSDADIKFDAVVDAAAHGATVGEFTSSLRHAKTPDEERVTPIPPVRASEPFETLRHRVSAWQQERPAAVFLANVGPYGDYMPRLDFVRSFYQVGGFGVNSDDWFASAAEALAAAKASSARVVVITGLDATYEDAVPVIAGGLKDEAGIQVHLAGYPKDKVDDYRAAGVDAFIHIKSDVLATLNGLAATLGA